MNPAHSERGYRMARVDSLGVGDFIERKGYYGEIVHVHAHGRQIGDGTVEWFTWRVQPHDRKWPHNSSQRPRDTCGPLRADCLVRCWS